jgi:hypothetical protein
MDLGRWLGCETQRKGGKALGGTAVLAGSMCFSIPVQPSVSRTVPGSRMGPWLAAVLAASLGARAHSSEPAAKRQGDGRAVNSVASSGAASPQDPPTGEARGVNPADNITKFELQPRLGVIDDSASISTTTLTLKYDRAIQGIYGLNFELPLARFESPGLSANGVGDLNVRARYQARVGQMTVIAGVESVLPVASDDLLGSGKWQLNPTLAVVQPLAGTAFLAGVVKSINSVAGDDARPDLSQLQLRALLGYSSPQGWWVLADPQYWIDRDGGDRNEFVVEFEYGRMVSPTTGVWLRAGGRAGGNWNRGDWTVGGGIRFISF